MAYVARQLQLAAEFQTREVVAPLESAMPSPEQPLVEPGSAGGLDDPLSLDEALPSQLAARGRMQFGTTTAFQLLRQNAF